MRKFKVMYADGKKEILSKKELAEKINSYGYRLGRSIEGRLFTGNIFVLEFKIID